MIHCTAAVGDTEPHVTRSISWDAVQYMMSIVPPLTDNRSHKGQHGRVVVIGGSARYTGAPYYAGMVIH